MENKKNINELTAYFTSTLPTNYFSDFTEELEEIRGFNMMSNSTADLRFQKAEINKIIKSVKSKGTKDKKEFLKKVEAEVVKRMLEHMPEIDELNNYMETLGSRIEELDLAKKQALREEWITLAGDRLGDSLEPFLNRVLKTNLVPRESTIIDEMTNLRLKELELKEEPEVAVKVYRVTIVDLNASELRKLLTEYGKRVIK